MMRNNHCQAAARDGFALVITLAFLVLVTGVIVALFTLSETNRKISFSSVNQVKADELARSAADILVGELRHQIVHPDRSRQTNAPSSYRPTNAATALPHFNSVVRGGSNALANNADSAYGNLVNLSVPDPLAGTGVHALFPQGRPLLSGVENTPVLTETPSRNRRSTLSERRFDTSTGLAQDASASDPNAMLLPAHWVLITRSGIISVPDGASMTTALGDMNDPASAGFVIGRFAYYIYNLGNTLDINVAGGPGAASAQMLGKNSLATADLASLTDPANGDQPLLTREQANSLVNWRNASTVANYEDYLREFAIPQGFLSARAGDNVFFSRQDLLDYIDENIGSDVASRRLAEYFTHFSRGSNRADLIPAYNAADRGGSLPAYRTNADGQNNNNRDILGNNLRVATPFTRQNGEPAVVGEPLVKHKFPLERLDWIRFDGPAPGITDEQIQASFGLQWDAPNKSWRYVGPTGSAVLTAIARLNQVAAQNREPNFFELLKAGILFGSLGLHPTNDSGPNSRADHTNTFPSNFFGNPDNHVIQIGANIVDQFDADSFPTRIQFGQTRAGAANVADAIVGVEAVPYFYRFLFTPFRPIVHDPDRNFFSAWLEPVFWNPSQTENAPPSGAAPQAFRLRLVANATAAATSHRNETNPETFTTTNLTPNLGAGASMTFSGSDLAGQTFTPQRASTLRALGASFSWARSNGLPADQALFDYTEESTNYLGFYLGRAYAPVAPPDAPPRPYTHCHMNFGTTGSIFVLEADYGGGDFREIQRWQPTGSGAWTADGDLWRTLERRGYMIGYNDPRTDRFGLNMVSPVPFTSGVAAHVASLTETLAWSPTRLYVNSTAQRSRADSITMVPNFGSTGSSPQWNRGSLYRFADNSGAPGIPGGNHTNLDGSAVGQAAGISSTNPVYTDRDAVQRRGDGWWSTSDHTLPMRGEARFRPILLNRPFQNVAELGYVFRDLPWKSLDFVSLNSADSGLLGLFTIGERAPTKVAGKVDLRTPHAGVLAAVITGASSGNPSSNGAFTSAEALTVANAIVGRASAGLFYDTNKLLIPSAPTELGSVTSVLDHESPLLGSISAVSPSESAPLSRIKAEREAVARALVGSGQLDTWNLLIDVVAQAGRFPSGPGTTQADFIVEGEKRYWLSIAIDRNTGQIIDRQLEPVLR